MYSNGFLPLINKPTRITNDTATIIDHIFKNDIDRCSNIFNGILINDISDHLPIFVVCNQSVSRMDAKVSQYIRQTSEDNIARFNSELQNQNWDSVLSSSVNVAYNNFVNIFTSLLNKCCPVQKVAVDNGQKYKPWFSSGLKNVCNKKNNLYKNFLSNRTKSNEIRYKTYKNK